MLHKKALMLLIDCPCMGQFADIVVQNINWLMSDVSVWEWH